MARADSTRDEDGYERCRALTDDGERCSREAEANGFCFQHGPDDECVDEQRDGDAGDVADDGMREGGERSKDTEGKSMTMREARETIERVTTEIIDRPLDGVIEIEKDDGWHAAVEVVERSAVPDTQDILGRYQITLDSDGEVRHYRLTDRYRRGNTANSFE